MGALAKSNKSPALHAADYAGYRLDQAIIGDTVIVRLVDRRGYRATLSGRIALEWLKQERQRKGK